MAHGPYTSSRAAFPFSFSMGTGNWNTPPAFQTILDLDLIKFYYVITRFQQQMHLFPRKKWHRTLRSNQSRRTGIFQSQGSCLSALLSRNGYMDDALDICMNSLNTLQVVQHSHASLDFVLPFGLDFQCSPVRNIHIPSDYMAEEAYQSAEPRNETSYIKFGHHFDWIKNTHEQTLSEI